MQALPPRWSSRWSVVLALAVAVVGAGAGCGGGAGQAVAAKARLAPLVKVAPVEKRDVPVEVRAPIDLRPLAQVDVGSKTLGYLDAVLVDRGDRVMKGQLLAVVRPSDLPDQLSAARSALVQAQSMATLARTNLGRAEALAPEEVVSQQELQQTRARAAEAHAAEDAARSQIGALAARLGETKIVAPLTGVVVQRRLDPGALVGPPGGGAIVTVARVDVLRAFIAVNERDVSGVTLGLDAHVEVDALPGRSFGGKLVRIAPALDPSTRTLEAEVQIDNRSGALMPGMYGRGAIVVAVHRGSLVAPIGAIQLNERRAFLFVVEGDTARRRAVETAVDGGDWMEVRSGVREGERIVLAGIDGLADGMKVRVAAPVPDKAAPPPGSTGR
jgi:RND family efflux transporter MFP subunit